MLTVKAVRMGAPLPPSKYNRSKYIILNKSNVVMAVFDKREELEKSVSIASGYYDDCKVEARDYDLYRNDNSLVDEFDNLRQELRKEQENK